jgi:hypothetical protein
MVRQRLSSRMPCRDSIHVVRARPSSQVCGLPDDRPAIVSPTPGLRQARRKRLESRLGQKTQKIPTLEATEIETIFAAAKKLYRALYCMRRLDEDKSEVAVFLFATGF